MGQTKWDCDPGKYGICVLPGIYLIEEKIRVLFSQGLFKWEDTTLGRTVVILSGIRREFVCRMKLRRDNGEKQMEIKIFEIFVSLQLLGF